MLFMGRRKKRGIFNFMKAPKRKPNKGVLFRKFKTKPDGSIIVSDFSYKNGFSSYTWRKPENNWGNNKKNPKKKKKVKFTFMSKGRKIGGW